MKHRLSYCALALALSLNANAALMMFNFNDLTGGITAVTEDQMAGTPALMLQGADVVPAGQAGVAYTNASGVKHAAGKAAAWDSGINDSGGNSMTLHFDATGFQNFSLRYDYRSTTTGCPSAALRYQVGDTGTWIVLGTDSYTQEPASPVHFNSATRDLSSLTILNNASSVYLQWVLAAGSGSGTFQLDNLELTGAAVPEPRECVLVVGLGLGVFAGYRRRRSRALEGMKG